VALIQDGPIDITSYQIRTAQQGKYLKAIKLFCEMNEIQVGWKKFPFLVQISVSEV
jgi:hypothetical protein